MTSILKLKETIAIVHIQQMYIPKDLYKDIDNLLNLIINCAQTQTRKRKTMKQWQNQNKFNIA